MKAWAGSSRGCPDGPRSSCLQAGFSCPVHTLCLEGRLWKVVEFEAEYDLERPDATSSPAAAGWRRDGRESGLEGRDLTYFEAAIPCACSVRPTIPHSQLPLTHYVPAVGRHILCATCPPVFESPAPWGACLISRHLEGWEPRLCGAAKGAPVPRTIELSLPPVLPASWPAR